MQKLRRKPSKSRQPARASLTARALQAWQAEQRNEQRHEREQRAHRREVARETLRQWLAERHLEADSGIKLVETTQGTNAEYYAVVDKQWRFSIDVSPDDRPRSIKVDCSLCDDWNAFVRNITEGDLLVRLGRHADECDPDEDDDDDDDEDYDDEED